MSHSLLLGRLAVIVTIAAATNTALAAPPSAVQDAGETAQYRALLEEAVSEYDARRYEEARALFRRAHDISPNSRTLRGIGMASFELREYVEALRSLEGALADKRRPLTPTQRQQVDSLLERTRAFVGRFFVKAQPKETVVRVDGAPSVLESDGSLLLSFGRHSLTAEASGSVSESREINVIGGERQELTFQLRADSSGQPAGKSDAVVATSPPATGADAGASGAGWWFAGAGVLAAGAIVGYTSFKWNDDTISSCDKLAMGGANGTCLKRDTAVSNRRLALAATIGASSGALVLGIIGAVLWSTNSKPESGTALACAPGPGAVNCELKIAF
jgi:hypothetical protein